MEKKEEWFSVLIKNNNINNQSTDTTTIGDVPITPSTSSSHNQSGCIYLLLFIKMTTVFSLRIASKRCVTSSYQHCCITRRSKRTLTSSQSIQYYFLKEKEQPSNIPSLSLLSSTSSSSFSTSSITKRPFEILGLQQVAVGSTDLQSLRYLWMDIFGLKKINTHSSEKENVMEDILLICSTTNNNNHNHNNVINHHIPVELDLMCPIDENKSPKVSRNVLLSIN